MTKDCVSREAVREAIMKCETMSEDSADGYIKSTTELEAEIACLPPVIPTHKVGKWKRKLIDSGYNSVWLCSECKEMIHLEFHDFKFCPYCGAEMEGGKNG